MASDCESQPDVFEVSEGKIENSESEDEESSQIQMEVESTTSSGLHMTTSSSLQLILASIAHERSKECQPQQLISEGNY